MPNKKKLLDPKHLSLAAHLAASEIAMMDLLKLPLTNVCNASDHHELILSLLFKCKFQPSSETWAEALVFPGPRARDILVYVFRQIGDPAGEKNDASEAMINDAAKIESVEAEEDAEEEAKTGTEGVEAQKKDDASEAMTSETGRESVEAEEEEETEARTGIEGVDVEEEIEMEETAESEEPDDVNARSLFSKDGVHYIYDSTFRTQPLTDLAVKFAVRCPPTSTHK